MEPHNKSLPKLGVLVPFYRGAVVFEKHESDPVTAKSCSRPLLSRSGCIYYDALKLFLKNNVLVPFYRGAVVFT